MGGLATAVQIAERAALAAIQSDSEDPWAHHALGCVYLFTRRFEDSLAELELALDLNPNFSLAQGYYGLALSYCGRWEEADEAARARTAIEPARSIRGSLRRDRRLRPIHRTQLRRGDATSARSHPAAWRFRRRPPRTRRRRRHGRTEEVATAALQELRRAQPNISLAWIADEMPIKQEAEREHYLEAFRRAGLD